ncbi:hypothetical protein [Streptomyces sp. NRRL F-5123]|uniref:hypothetical protein n=1 Tax=Streptomyces sp. NRRL F-5123 TaxID=1463856 RepID=UPI0004E12B8B|nr:hypothetical protein [Streptomyces sp. NRRL F-5123]
MLRSLLALPAAALAAAAVPAAGGPAAADTAPPAACAPAVVAGDLAFSPPSVSPGGTSSASLTVTNCTGEPQTVGETWYGRFLSGSSAGLPAGCPVVDPLPRPVTVAPHASVTSATGYLVFPGCTADRLRLTVTLVQAGTTLGSRTADLLIDQPAAAPQRRG